jgi:hypothetical protein
VIDKEVGPDPLGEGDEGRYHLHPRAEGIDEVCPLVKRGVEGEDIVPAN